MKTATVKTQKMQRSNYPAVLKKVSVNPGMSPLKGLSRKHENNLCIQGYELREWLEHLSGSEGLYLLDIGSMDSNTYSLHFKHNATGKLMELDCPEPAKDTEDKRKEFLSALLFDLSLFPDENILCFDSGAIEQQLRNLAAIYREHSKELDCIIGRLVDIDLKKVFTSIYQDSRIEDLSLDGIYHGLYPGISRTFSKAQGSFAIWLIYLAVHTIFQQLTGKKAMA